MKKTLAVLVAMLNACPSFAQGPVRWVQERRGGYYPPGYCAGAPADCGYAPAEDMQAYHALNRMLSPEDQIALGSLPDPKPAFYPNDPELKRLIDHLQRTRRTDVRFIGATQDNRRPGFLIQFEDDRRGASGPVSMIFYPKVSVGESVFEASYAVLAPKDSPRGDGANWLTQTPPVENLAESEVQWNLVQKNGGFVPEPGNGSLVSGFKRSQLLAMPPQPAQADPPAVSAAPSGMTGGMGTTGAKLPPRAQPPVMSRTEPPPNPTKAPAPAKAATFKEELQAALQPFADALTKVSAGVQKLSESQLQMKKGLEAEIAKIRAESKEEIDSLKNEMNQLRVEPKLAQYLETFPKDPKAAGEILSGIAKSKLDYAAASLLADMMTKEASKTLGTNSSDAETKASFEKLGRLSEAGAEVFKGFGTEETSKLISSVSMALVPDISGDHRQANAKIVGMIDRLWPALASLDASEIGRYRSPAMRDALLRIVLARAAGSQDADSRLGALRVIDGMIKTEGFQIDDKHLPELVHIADYALWDGRPKNRKNSAGTEASDYWKKEESAKAVVREVLPIMEYALNRVGKDATFVDSDGQSKNVIESRSLLLAQYVKRFKGTHDPKAPLEAGDAFSPEIAGKLTDALRRVIEKRAGEVPTLRKIVEESSGEQFPEPTPAPAPVPPPVSAPAKS